MSSDGQSRCVVIPKTCDLFADTGSRGQSSLDHTLHGGRGVCFVYGSIRRQGHVCVGAVRELPVYRESSSEPHGGPTKERAIKFPP
jgi:hypothetical protein